MSNDYERNREAFNRAAGRIQEHVNRHGGSMSHDEARKKLRKHITRSKNK